MTVDVDREWRRLQEYYAGLSDEEILLLEGEQADLTSLAREALHAEIGSRGLKAGGAPEDVESDESERFVLLLQETDLPTILFQKASLESLDIEAEIDFEERHSLAWFIRYAADGLTLRVRRKDVERALEALRPPSEEEMTQEAE